MNDLTRDKVIPFPRHRFHACNADRCTICEGGLGYCKTCGGLEGSLPTDCPQERMEPEIEQAVYAGSIDFDRFDGWVERSVHAYESRHRWTKSGIKG